MQSQYESVKARLRRHPKTWLIAGVAGFIGSNLLETLLKLDQNVIGLDNFFSGYRHNLEEVQKRISLEQWGKFNFVIGDIRELSICSSICKTVDYVLHQAALGSVPHSLQDPVLANEININGFLNMLIAARDSDVQRFVYASSSAVYGDHPELPKRENQIGNQLSPYAVTKLVDELYSDVFTKAYCFKTIGLRYFNIFGPRQDPNGAYAAVIPKWFAGLIENQSISIYGDGETSRDFCYIDNCVQANILAATVENEEALNQVYNVAYGERTSLNELFTLIKEQVAKIYPHARDIEPQYRDFRAGDVHHSLADIGRASKMLGYNPSCSVREGLADTAAWIVKKETSQRNISNVKIESYKSKYISA